MEQRLKAEKVKIKAFQVWCWRRALRISQTEKIRNDEIFKENEHSEITVEYAEIQKKNVDRTPIKKEPLDNHSNKK